MEEIGGLLPHGYCFSWQKDLLLLHILSDGLTALAYFSIPVALWSFVRRRTDLEFRSAFIMFGVFIMACGLTHVMDIWTLWHPDFWIDGWIRAFTAAVSVVTAILLWRLIPFALRLPSPQALRAANEGLRQEIERRQDYEVQLHVLNQRLRQQVEELEAMTYAIAHDVKGPLRHIDGFARILNDNAAMKDPGAAGYLGRIRASVKHLTDIVEGLLALSRASRSELNPVEVDTGALVREALDELSPDMDGREVDIHIGALPPVRADRKLLFQVFYNLLSNAVKYSRSRSPARITIDATYRAGHGHTFSISDNGAGFDMKYAHKLFGVFQRLHHTDEFEGTGIGLANVKRIVERHGGQVRAEGSLDNGACFRFTLPDVMDLPDSPHSSHSTLSPSSTGVSNVAALA